MSGNGQAPEQRSTTRWVEGALVAAIFVILAGLVVPVFQCWELRTQEAKARTAMAEIGDGIHRFMRDTGTTPTRGRDGTDGKLLRLIGPGLIGEGAYFFPDGVQGSLESHLVRNEPQGRTGPGYSDWAGPYVGAIAPDPWGFAYVVVAYPLTCEDGRDCVVVSGGPDGRFDGDYSSPRDVVPAGDDLLVVVLDRLPLRPAVRR